MTLLQNKKNGWLARRLILAELYETSPDIVMYESSGLHATIPMVTKSPMLKRGKENMLACNMQ